MCIRDRAITTAIMITFKNFNLYRLLSQQVAPVCLDSKQPGGNAFLNFFERVTTGRQTLLRVTGRARARGHCLFPLSASTKTQSSGQNSHNHDNFKKFQSISPLSLIHISEPTRLLSISYAV